MQFLISCFAVVLISTIVYGQIDEREKRQVCTQNNGGCEQGCQMRRGQANCFCNPGYDLKNDQKTCSDIDECRRNPCQGNCRNTVGSFQCTCRNGLVVLEDGVSCGEATTSCAVNNGGCAQECKQQPNGNIRCKCNKGHQLGPNKRSCLDIDECASGTHSCRQNKVCENTEGSYKCNAKRGEPAAAKSCDVNNGGCDQRCRVTKKGRVRCACKNGFKLQPDGTSCQSEGQADKCANNNGGCEQKCRLNNRGNVVCNCNKGFKLRANGKTCQSNSPVDKCAKNNGGCEQRCRQNNRGNVICNCNKGFKLQRNGKNCQRDGPVDKCATNNGGCEIRCRQNKRGIVICNCNKGFFLKPDRKTCQPEKVLGPLNLCQVDNGGCQQLCNLVNGQVVCSCNSGFIASGPKCVGEVEAPLPELLTDGCGVNTKKSLIRRIVGGKRAEPDDWPWMAALLKEGESQQFCGGSLITHEHVLTAAHCIFRFTKEEIKVRLGEYDFAAADDNNPLDFRVVNMIFHAGYNTDTQENDIALLKLGKPATFSEFVRPVCLPPAGFDFAGQRGYVVGWGTIHFGGPVSSILQEVLLPVWNQTECISAYKTHKVTDEMMCAGERAGGKDSCQGDSGGPFLVQIFPDSRWYVAGIVSWGVECASPNRPGVYARVNKYLDWIGENVAKL